MKLSVCIKALFMALLSISSVKTTLAAEGKRPNVLFIFSDDHAYQSVSAYGFGLNQTPNIDRLAKEGMRFDRCVVPNSICGSRQGPCESM